MGSDVNAQSKAVHNTPLTVACFYGKSEIVSLLLDKKANIEHRSEVCILALLHFF